MADLIPVVLAHRAGVNAVESARAVLAEAREQAATARDALISAAQSSGDPELVASAEGIGFCEEEIDKLREGEDGEKALSAAVKMAAADMRAVAANGGDAAAAVAVLTSAEADLAERRAGVRDLRKALKAHERNLEQLVRSIG